MPVDASSYAIETLGLRKIYRSPWTGRSILAVDGINLRVESGTTFGLLGANGAGKTTFVKMLLSAVHPSEGEARIFGRNAAIPEARRDVGYLPENHRFPTYLTGQGMLDFYGALSGMDSRTRAQRIPELLDLVGLGSWATVRLNKYSKGMLQRLGLAQALMHRPKLLILDEPSDGVDPVGRHKIREILQALQEKGVTIFLNSHLLAEVEMFCQDVAILDRGRLVLEGKVKQLTAGKGYRLSVSNALPEALRQALTATAASFAARDSLLEFQFPSRNEVNRAIDLLRREQVDIESVEPTRSTLEEVFLETLQAAAPSAMPHQGGKA
ncbi:MAG: ABC transporter ATP-binding protein [Bryobacteraceae bacterium]|nr:ABC transporter ATP-binding protein [Bryobacteraceae bacterium]MDW8378306.1 ABC transporter ATP-binding protein [Bryobacterales bacterium]